MAVLTLIHILFGSLGIAAIAGALLSRKGSRVHRRSGTTAYFSLMLSLVAATVVSILTSNLFLLLIAGFTAYLLYTGRRIAQARDSQISGTDKLVFTATLLLSLSMIAYSIHLWRVGNPAVWPLLLFGLIAFALSLSDLLRNGTWPEDNDRIALHLTRMGGASIAVLTAVMVVNVSTSPAWVVWVAPTVLLTPAISYMAYQLKNADVP